jgi:hypothetical protein
MTLRFLRVMATLADEKGVFSITKATDKIYRLYPAYHNIFKVGVKSRIYNMVYSSKPYIYRMNENEYRLTSEVIDYLIENSDIEDFII